MSYTFEFDFGAGWVDYTAYADGSPKIDGRNPIRERYRAAHKNLKPVVSTCSFAIIRDATLINLFFASTADVQVRILKDSAAYFKGTVRPTFKEKLGSMKTQGLLVECVGAWYRLEKKIDFTETWSGYAISSPTATASSILHQLFYRAGFSDAELSFPAIATTVDHAVFEATSGKTFRAIIEKILEEVGYSALDTPAGVVELVELFPASIASGGTLSFGHAGNMAGTPERSREEAAVEAVDVTYWPHVTLSDVTLFEDTTGATGGLACSIPVAAGDYYPEEAASGVSVRANYKVDDADLLYASGAVLDESHTGAIAVQDDTEAALGMDLRLYSSTGGVIQRLKVVGDAVVKGDECKISVENVAGTAKREGIECEWIAALAPATVLAQGRSTWHKYAATTYVLPEVTDLTIAPGAYRTISASGLWGISQLVRVVAVVDGPNPKAVKVLCEAVGELETKTVVEDYAKASSSAAASAAAAAQAARLRVLSSLSVDALYLYEVASFAGRYYQCTVLSPVTWEAIDAIAPSVVAAFHRLDEVPAIPDGAAGTTYRQDAWATVDSWAEGAGGTLAAVGGVLRHSSASTDSEYIRRVASQAASSTVKIRARITAGTLSGVTLTTSLGSTGISFAPTAAWQIFNLMPVTNWTGTLTTVSLAMGVHSADCVLEIDWIYIGDGTYTTVAPDNSGHGDHLTLYGPTPSDDGFILDGVNDYALRALSSPKLIVSMAVPAKVTATEVVSALISTLKYNSGANGSGSALVPHTATSARVYAGRGGGLDYQYKDIAYTWDTTASHKYALVWDVADRTASLYVDGVLVGTTAAFDATINLSASYYVLGRWAGDVSGYYYSATMRDAVFSETAFSLPEIHGLALGLMPPVSYRLADWQFGQVAADSTVTPQEKQTYVYPRWYSINGNGSTTGSYWVYRAKAIAAGIAAGNALIVALDAAQAALLAYLYTTPGVLTATTWLSNIPVTAATWVGLWDAYTVAEANVISGTASQLASNAVTTAGNNVATLAPKNRGRFSAAHPASHNSGDWWTVYDTDDSPIERGVWYSAGGTPTRISAVSGETGYTMDETLLAKLSASMPNVAWAEKNAYGTAADYGISVYFEAFAATTALIDNLHVKHLDAADGDFAGELNAWGDVTAYSGDKDAPEEGDDYLKLTGGDLKIYQRESGAWVLMGILTAALQTIGAESFEGMGVTDGTNGLPWIAGQLISLGNVFAVGQFCSARASSTSGSTWASLGGEIPEGSLWILSVTCYHNSGTQFRRSLVSRQIGSAAAFSTGEAPGTAPAQEPLQITAGNVVQIRAGDASPSSGRYTKASLLMINYSF